MLLKNLSEKKKKWLGFISVVSSISVLFTDQSILPVALPTIQQQFLSTSTELQWMINAYFLALAIFILAAGKLSDIFGYRRIFLLGLTIFSFSSIFLAISMNSIWLISFRFVQGTGAALMVPSSFSILLDLFPKEKRGMAVGLNAAVGSFFLALAPYIGGLFTQYLSWRWVFWINIPICFVGQIFGILAIGKPEITKQKFDFLGFFSFIVAMISFALAFMQAKVWGWDSPGVIALFVFSLIFFCFMYFLMKKSKNPFIDFSLYKCRTFSSSNITIFLVQLSGGITIFWAVYFQYLLNFSPVKAGVTMLIVAIPIMIMAPIGGRLMDKYSYKLPISLGLVFIAFAYAWFSIFFKTASILHLLPAFLLLGTGYTFVMSVSFASGAGSVPYKDRGMGVGILGTQRAGGFTIGIAVMGAILINVHHVLFKKSLLQNKLTSNLDPNAFEGLLAKAPKAISALQKLPSNAIDFVKASYISSSETAFLAANILAAIIMFIGFIIFMIFNRKKS